jgi:hypothetical protein
MSDTLTEPTVEAAIARLEAAVDEIIGLSLTSSTDADVLALWRRLETVSRRLTVADHVCITQAQLRHMDFANGAKNMVVFARHALRISPREARLRIQAAEAAGPRQGLTGEALPPIYQKVASAQVAGEISAHHARVIVATIDALPDPIQAELGETLEAMLVDRAHHLDPDVLSSHAHDVAHALDQDGRLKDVAYRQRRRDIALQVRPDGSGHMDAELTAEAVEHLRVVFDALAKPKPAADGTHDPRTPGQRRHDALLDGMKMIMRARLLPNAGGISASVILTFTAQEWASGTGTARTGHGITVPAGEAKQWISGDTQMIGVVLGTMKRVEAYSSVHRILTEAQRLAMHARDGGCAFLGCDAPTQECEAHHMIDYADGGPSSTGNGALMCSSNHRDHKRMGYVGVMIDEVPHWIAPPWVDPTQTPQRNHMHDRGTDRFNE